MRKEFDQSVPEYEQRLNMPPKSHTGHKHMHTVGPGKKKSQDIAGIGRAKKKAKAFKQKVSQYWRGEADYYPAK